MIMDGGHKGPPDAATGAVIITHNECAEVPDSFERSENNKRANLLQDSPIPAVPCNTVHVP